MTPDPYIRNQAIGLGVVLVACGAVGLWGVAIVGLAITASLWLALRSAYRRRRRAWSPPASLESVRTREGLDGLVEGSTTGVLICGLAGAGVGVLVDVG